MPDGKQWGTSTITEKPDSAVSGGSCSSAASECIHPHCTIDSQWSGQHLLSVFCEQLFLILIFLILKPNFLKAIRIWGYNSHEKRYKLTCVCDATLWSDTDSALLHHVQFPSHNFVFGQSHLNLKGYKIEIHNDKAWGSQQRYWLHVPHQLTNQRRYTNMVAVTASSGSACA